MPDRLSSLDSSFLYLEESATPMHVASVAVLAGGRNRLDYDRLLTLVQQRLDAAPRFRQRVREIPGNLARPVWIDDPDFDITFHIRRSALPAPGSHDQLMELVARLVSRRLDPDRPLWELYLIEGLSGGKVALLSKTHQAVIEGSGAPDIEQVILDRRRNVRPGPSRPWIPHAAPHPPALVAEALADLVRRPSSAVDAVKLGLFDARSTARVMGGAAGQMLSAVRSAARPAPDSPLAVRVGPHRRVATAELELQQLRSVRAVLGGTVNDVVLAVVAGALRGWLLTRGEEVDRDAVLRAMVPLSVRSDAVAEDGDGGADQSVQSYLVDLPVGEANPVMRLRQISFVMQAHEDAGQAVSAKSMARLGGFAPPALHAAGAKAASGLSRRLFNLIVTNAPGPQAPLYAAGCKMLEVYPVVPLARGQALAIGVTSYNGGVYFGLNADREAMPDLAVLAGLIPESLAELTELAGA